MVEVASDYSMPGSATRVSRLSVELSTVLVPLVLIGFLNGDYVKVKASIAELGALEAIYATFKISIVIWVGMWLALDLLKDAKLGPVRRTDAIVMTVVAATFLVPISSLSWAGLTLLALYLILSRADDDLGRRAGWVILALAFSSQWSPMIFRLLMDYILQIDAFFVALFSGTTLDGNLVMAADGKTTLKVLAGCSSFANISLAFLGWIMARSYYGTRGFGRSVLFVAISAALVIFINTTRIGIIALRPDLYDLAHGPFGANIASLVTTLSIGVVSMLRGAPVTLARPHIAGLLALALLSIGLKIAFEVRPDYQKLGSLYLRDAIGALDTLGFQRLGSVRNGAVGGVKDACVLWIAATRPEGGDDDLLNRSLAATGRVAYWYRGEISADRPILKPILDRYHARLLSLFGETLVAPSVYYLSYNRSCADDLIARIELPRAMMTLAR